MLNKNGEAKVLALEMILRLNKDTDIILVCTPFAHMRQQPGQPLVSFKVLAIHPREETAHEHSTNTPTRTAMNSRA